MSTIAPTITDKFGVSMVVIRLARGGAKRRPFYSVVVADSRFKRDGRYVEKLGYYNPVASGQAVPLLLDVARIEYWTSRGAQLSDTVARLLRDFKRSVPSAA